MAVEIESIFQIDAVLTLLESAEVEGTVRLPLRFEPNGSLFVVFRPGQPIEPDRITSVNRSNQPLLETIFQPHQANPARTNKDCATNFTIAVWARPEVEIDLPEEGTAGIYGEHAIRSDALNALVKGFDPNGTDDPAHPVWRRFKTIAGSDVAARKLFAGIPRQDDFASVAVDFTPGPAGLPADP